MRNPSTPGRRWPIVSMGMAGLLLAGLAACSGGSNASTATSGTATTLSYTAPVSRGYRLVQNAASTSTHLVLDLVGADGAQAQGVTFNISCDGAKAAWSAPIAGAGLVMNGKAFNLGTGVPLMKILATPSDVQAALYQKAGTPAASLQDQVLLTVALDLKPGAPKGPVALSGFRGAQIQDANGIDQTIAVAIGSLVAN